MENDATRPEPSVGSSQPVDPAVRARLEALEREAAELRARLGDGGTGGRVDASTGGRTDEGTGGRGDEGADAGSLASSTASSEFSTTGAVEALSPDLLAQDSPSSVPPSPRPPVEASPTPPVPSEEPEPPPPTADQITKAENLIRQARLARSRGQGAQATDFLKQAEQVAPNAPSVLEFIGDDYAERSRYKEAREVYKKALRYSKNNIALENKHALAVLKTGGGGSAMMYSEFESVANAKAAVVFTVLLPGLGQIVTGQLTKGISIMVPWFICAFWAGWDLFKLGHLAGLMDALFGRPSKHEFSWMVMFPLGVALLIHLGAIFDSASMAKQADKKIVIRPQPPENLPFE